jgi:hypothetical protein
LLQQGAPQGTLQATKKGHCTSHKKFCVCMRVCFFVVKGRRNAKIQQWQPKNGNMMMIERPWSEDIHLQVGNVARAYEILTPLSLSLFLSLSLVKLRVISMHRSREHPIEMLSSSSSSSYYGTVVARCKINQKDPIKLKFNFLILHFEIQPFFVDTIFCGNDEKEMTVYYLDLDFWIFGCSALEG